MFLDLGSEVTISNSYFSKNSGTEGGAIACGGKLQVINSTFVENNAPPRGAAPGGGGAIAANGGCTAEISGSTFTRNTGSGGAGAVSSYSGKFFFTNCTFFGNSAPVGGSFENKGPDVEMIITHSTIAGNQASGAGSAINSEGRMVLRNTIIANNTGGAQCAGTITNGGNNLRFPANDASCPGTAGDPKLSALANNGGATQTMALQPGSAALDKIAAANGCGVGVTIDQRGIARPQGTACDIGAFELQAPSEVPEADTLLLLGGGLGGLATWVRYQWSRRKTIQK